MSLYTETILPPREGPALPRWAVALVIVLAIHLIAGIYIAMRHGSGKPLGQPTDTVMIDLAPVLTAPPQPKAAPPAPRPEVAQPKAEPPPEPTPPPPEPPLQSVPEVPAEMTPPPVTPPTPKILETQEAPVVMPPPPKPVPDKMQEQKRIEVRKRVEQERKRKEKAELRKERADELRKDRAERARAAASVRAKQASRRAAAPRAGASSQSIAAWQSEVQARVYAAAQSVSGESGSATLMFTVDANGRVASARIARTSGSAALDRATLSIARRIGRLPPPPNGRVSIRVPVRFKSG